MSTAASDVASPFDPFTALRGQQDADMSYEERKAAWEQEQKEKSVGGKADGGAGRVRWPAPESMNDLIREATYGR
jgi:hypothetical protein